MWAVSPLPRILTSAMRCSLDVTRRVCLNSWLDSTAPSRAQPTAASPSTRSIRPVGSNPPDASQDGVEQTVTYQRPLRRLLLLQTPDPILCRYRRRSALVTT